MTFQKYFIYFNIIFWSIFLHNVMIFFLIIVQRILNIFYKFILLAILNFITKIVIPNSHFKFLLIIQKFGFIKDIRQRKYTVIKLKT